MLNNVHIIHCVENKKRYENILYQIDNNSWLQERFKIYWTCYFPHSDIAANAMILSNKSRYISNKNEYNLIREFYRIIKVEYLKGSNDICIFEDDFSLMKQPLFDKFIDNVPEDFDIIQLSYLFNHNLYEYSNLIKEYNNGKLWINKTFGAWSNNGIILSRKGMKYFIDTVDNELQAADIPMFESKNVLQYFGKCNQNDLKHYIPTLPLVYVDGYDSTVQNDTKNDLYFLYRNVLNKENYSIFK